MMNSVITDTHYSRRSNDLLIPGFIVVCIGLMLWAFSHPFGVELRQSIQLFVAETNVVVVVEFVRMLLDHLLQWASEFLMIYLPTLAQM